MPAWRGPARSPSWRPRTAAGWWWPSSAAAACSAWCDRPARRATPRSSRSPRGLEPGRRDVDQRRRRTSRGRPTVTCWPRGWSATPRRSTACPARWTSTRPRPPARAPGGRRWRSPPTASPPWCGARAATPTPGGSSSCACRPRRRTSARAPTSPTSPARTTRASPGSSSARAGRPSHGGSSARRSTRRCRSRAARRPTPARVAINGRGVGYAGVGGSATLGAYGAVLKDDLFNPGAIIGGGFGVVPVPVAGGGRERRRPRRLPAGRRRRRAHRARAPLRLRAGVAGRHRRRAPTRRSPTPPWGRPTPRAGSRPAPIAPATWPWPSSRATATPGGSWPPATTAPRAPSGRARRPSGASSRARR